MNRRSFLGSLVGAALASKLPINPALLPKSRMPWTDILAEGFRLEHLMVSLVDLNVYRPYPFHEDIEWVPRRALVATKEIPNVVRGDSRIDGGNVIFEAVSGNHTCGLLLWGKSGPASPLVYCFDGSDWTKSCGVPFHPNGGDVAIVWPNDKGIVYFS